MLKAGIRMGQRVVWGFGGRSMSQATYQVSRAGVVSPVRSVADATSSRVAPKIRNIRAQKNAHATARSVQNSVNTRGNMMGRGLSSMREHKVRTSMIVGSGMAVAAAVRNTGPGTSQGSTSMYRY